MIVEPLSNEDEWQSFVAGCPEGTFFHTLKWKEVLEKSFNVEPLYLVVRNSKREMVGLCPFVIWKELKLFKVIDSLKNSDCGGPLFREGYAGPGAQALMDFLKQLVRNRGITYARLRCSREELCQEFRIPGSRVDTSSGTMILDLQERSADFFWSKGIDTNRRKAIKRIYRDGFQSKIAKSLQEVRQFYDIYQENMAYLGGVTYPLTFFENLFDLLTPGSCNILLIARDQECIAGWTFFAYEPTKTIYVNYMGLRRTVYTVFDCLTWELSKWAEAKSYRYINLGSTPSDPVEIHYRQKFKTGAAFRQDYIVILPLNRIRFLSRELTANFGKRIITRLPKPVQQKVLHEATEGRLY
jgi:hypothetical protein